MMIARRSLLLTALFSAPVVWAYPRTGLLDIRAIERRRLQVIALVIAVVLLLLPVGWWAGLGG